MIREIADLMDTNFMSADEIQQTVNKVTEGVGTSALDFEKACQMYNLDFFRGEGVEFSQRVAAALVYQFPRFKNLYWVKLAGPILPYVASDSEVDIQIEPSKMQSLTVFPGSEAPEVETAPPEVMAEMIVDQIEPVNQPTMAETDPAADDDTEQNDSKNEKEEL